MKHRICWLCGGTIRKKGFNSCSTCRRLGATYLRRQIGTNLIDLGTLAITRGERYEGGGRQHFDQLLKQLRRRGSRPRRIAEQLKTSLDRILKEAA